MTEMEIEAWEIPKETYGDGEGMGVRNLLKYVFGSFLLHFAFVIEIVEYIGAKYFCIFNFEQIDELTEYLLKF